LSALYLVRHGQAGLRHNYDTLSHLGRRQAGLLGDCLLAQGVRFQALYAGALARQRQTAEAVWQAYRQAGVAAPEIVTDANWNEFDLDQVYRDFAPLLAAADSRFRNDYDELRRQARDQSSPVHRTWSPCDTAVVRAWTEGAYPCQGESWLAFQARVMRGLEALKQFGGGVSVGVCTSATPIAVAVGTALGIANGRIMRLAGVMYNSALTTMRLRGDDLRLFTFNGTPHLPDVELRTLR
jgi:broad specificity phosphatase PhoE